MSNVTPIYQGLIAKLAEMFPNKTRIPNPYSLPDNADNFLVDGYGLKVGGSSYVPFENQSFVNQRQFSVVYSREAMATESDTDVPDDISLKLLEDVYEVQKVFYAEDKMGIPEIMNVDLGSSSDVVAVKSGTKNYLSMEVSFLISIREIL